MGLEKNDIVYVVKWGVRQEELRYSLRSVAKNFPHNRIWFFGDSAPIWVQNVEKYEHWQVGRSKWEKVNDSLKEVCENPFVSEDFIFFNDDFYVMKPVQRLENLYEGTLIDRANIISSDRPGIASRYVNELREASDILLKKGLDNLNYELHVPMKFNKKKLLKILEEYPESACRRSLYANMYNIRGKKGVDYKAYLEENDWNGKSTYFSTSNYGFYHGISRNTLDKLFGEKCKYEK